MQTAAKLSGSAALGIPNASVGRLGRRAFNVAMTTGASESLIQSRVLPNRTPRIAFALC